MRWCVLFLVSLLALMPVLGVPLTQCGYLNQTLTTYTLQNNVNSSGTCFAIIANNITLDLNGYTIGYDNDTSITVTNGDFELGVTTPTSWDFTGAPKAARRAGSFTDPVTLYSGAYAVNITMPGNNQTFNSTVPITLLPNRNYSLSAMVYNTVNNSIFFVVGFVNSSINVTQTGKNWRGFQYISVDFTTNSSPDPYTIYVTVGNSTLIPETGDVYIDDIRIQRHLTHGIVVGPKDWDISSETYIDLNQYGAANYIVIKNGQIMQLGDADDADGIMVGSGNVGITVSNVTITVKGEDSHNIIFEGMTNGSIHDSTLISNVTTVTVRDHFDGSIIGMEYASSGSIYNNVMTGNPQNGIQTASTRPGELHIYNNIISLNTKYTNGFAINLYGDNGSYVYNNTIDCYSGSTSCRGIFTGGSRGYTKIYNNNITVRERDRSQEYDGCVVNGAYGIQVETTSHVQVFNNYVTAYGRECPAATFRSNPESTSVNVSVYNNTFIANTNGSNFVATALLADTTSALSFANNTFSTNYYWIRGESYNEFVNFTSNTFQFESANLTPYLFTIYDWDAPELNTTNFTFIDNRYPNATTKAAFEAISINCLSTGACAKNATSTIDNYSSFVYSWTLRVNATNGSGSPVVGAQVNITNLLNRNITGVTGSNGVLSIVLPQFWNRAGTLTTYTPYTVWVSSGSDTLNSTVQLTNTTTVDFSFTQVTNTSFVFSGIVRKSAGVFCSSCNVTITFGNETNSSLTNTTGSFRIDINSTLTTGEHLALLNITDSPSNWVFKKRVTVT
jgi:hypothetical protein